MKTDVSQTLRSALAVFAAALLLASCGGDSGGSTTTPAPAPAPAPAPTPPPAPPEPEEPEMATYDIGFTPLFSSNPLFQLLGASPFPENAGGAENIAFFAHPVDTMLWEVGGMASAGLKTLAETVGENGDGDSSALNAEAEAMGFAIVARSFSEIIAVLGAEEITLSHEMPCLSYAQRLNPTPDWFFGFSSACAVDEDGNWVEELSLSIVMYDAGTAEGEPYMEASGGTDPQQPITKVETPPWDTAPVSTIVGTLRAQ